MRLLKVVDYHPSVLIFAPSPARSLVSLLSSSLVLLHTQPTTLPTRRHGWPGLPRRTQRSAALFIRDLRLRNVKRQK